jgi:hypothetical protein
MKRLFFPEGIRRLFKFSRFLLFNFFICCNAEKALKAFCICVCGSVVDPYIFLGDPYPRIRNPE